MGKFSRRFKRRLVVEQKKALNKVYKNKGIQGLLGGLDYGQEEKDIEVAEHVSSMDVAEQEGTEIQGQEEGIETELMPDESQEGNVS